MRKDLQPKSLSIETQQKNSGKVSNPRIPVDVASFIALDDLMVSQAIAADRLDKLLKLEISKVPCGTATYNIVVTDTTQEFRLANPWISFSLINDGPGNIKVRVDKIEGGMTEEASVNNTETLSMDFRFPIVNSLYFVTEVAGTTAAIRIYAVEGRKWE